MNKITDAYDQIHAGDELIDSTKSRLMEIRNRQRNKKPKRTSGYRNLLRMSVVFAMIAVIVVLQGYRIDTQAASYISIDSLPSLELTLNKDGKVIDVKGYNESAKEILSEVSVKGKTYQEAIDLLMGSDSMKKYVTGTDSVYVTVVSEQEDKASSLSKEIESCHSLSGGNAVIDTKNEELLKEAHSNNMTAGKYAAYLELKDYDDTVSVEDCHHMTMGEIESCIHSHEGDHAEEECCEEEESSEQEEESCDHDEQECHDEH